METKNDIVKILGEDFFKDEIRCDYLVHAKIKKIWAIEMDLYLEFARVCNEMGLRHCVIYGTLLGTIRHKGFIPWDDDFDVAMPREDYDIFIKEGARHFRSPVFLQTPYTDPGYYVCFAKLRNCFSTGSSRVLLHQSFNQGIFLDIFPLDLCDSDECQCVRDTLIPYMKKCGAAMKRNSKYLTEEQQKDVSENFCVNPLEAWEITNKIARKKGNGDYYKDCCISVFTGYSVKKSVWPQSIFDSYEKRPFEKIEVVIPTGFDTLLRILYSDYLSFPPIENRGIQHDGFILEPDIPYTKYTEHARAGQEISYITNLVI